MTRLYNPIANSLVQPAVSTSVVTLSPPLGARGALLSLETATIRFTLDGTTPTSSVGTILYPGTTLELIGIHQLKNFKAIRSDTSDAQLDVVYYQGYNPLVV